MCWEKQSKLHYGPTLMSGSKNDSIWLPEIGSDNFAIHWFWKGRETVDQLHFGPVPGSEATPLSLLILSMGLPSLANPAPLWARWTVAVLSYPPTVVLALAGCIFFYFTFWNMFSSTLSWPGTSYTAEDDLVFLILLLPTHEHWDTGVHRSAHAVLGIEPRALCILGMRSIPWAISPLLLPVSLCISDWQDPAYRQNPRHPLSDISSSYSVSTDTW